MERIAILRFENLGADPSTDWIGRAFPEVIAAELTGTGGLYAISSERLHGLDAALGPRPLTAPGISSERTLAMAVGANRIGYGEYWVRDGKLEARLTIEDPALRRAVSSVSVSGGATDVVGLASSLAQTISGRIVPYGTHNSKVLQAYVGVIESADSGAADILEQAISADPNFSPAYRELAQAKLRRQDRPGALAALDQALSRGARLGALELARTQFDAATLRGDVDAREQALEALTRADPADPIAWRDLGLTYMSRHQYAPAAASFQSALHIEPDDPDSLNQLGYASAYMGNLEQGLEALNRYRKLQPENANPVDSLGDLNLLAGRWQEAKGYYLAAAKKSPEFFGGVDLLKAAMAQLMSGDTAGADTIAGQYFAARAAGRDPLVEFHQAQWQWLTGRRKAAFEQMQKLGASPERELAAAATAQASVWSLMMGNREAATTLAEKSLAQATQASGVTAAVARFLAQPPASAVEWTARAERLAPNPAQAAIRNTTLAYALLLSKQYQAAEPVLEQLYRQGQTAGEGLPVLLAWAYLETGRTAEAAGLLRFNPIPPTGGLDPLASLYFPRVFYLRGLAAERLGKAGEAQQSYALFEKLSGAGVPLLGEDLKAHQ